MDEKWDEKWKAFKENHIKTLKEFHISDECIEQDFERLFKILVEYTPTKYAKRTQNRNQL